MPVTPIDKEAICELLPHRDPFLFVDEVTGGDADASPAWLEARWTVPPDMDVFRGHFPGRPILPGVLIQEHTFQCGALLIYQSEGLTSLGGGLPVLSRVEDARFKHMVAPGTTLCTRVELTERLANARYLKAKVTTQDGKLVARLACVLAIAEESQ